MEARDDVPLQQMSREPSTYDSETLSSAQHQQEAPPYLADAQEEELPSYEQHNNTFEHIRSTPLHTNLFILIPVALYTTGVIYSWERICALSRIDPDGLAINNNNDKIATYRAARTIQTVTGLATIPIISFVCAWAAAVYVQNQRDAYSLRLRQVVTLADRSWLNPLVLLRMIFYRSGFKRYGSIMLYIAMFIHLFGAITYPIQSLFLSTRLVPVPPEDAIFYGELNPNIETVSTIPQLMGTADNVRPALTVRHQLRTAGVNGYQDNLWGNTSQLSGYQSDGSWFAPLSKNFSTGIASGQYIPRINCSANFESLDSSAFPSNCSEKSWFYASYTYPQSAWNLSLEACLPLNSPTPWNSTNYRQDFSEVLYVRVNGSNNGEVLSTPSSFKLELNTTAASFELPNYYNNQTAGPLSKNFSAACGFGCSYSGGAQLAGPLGIVSVALFGPGSFADTQQNATARSWTGPITSWTGDLATIDDSENLPLYNFGLNAGVQFAGNIPVDAWLQTFSINENQATISAATISSAFEQASFMAIKALFFQQGLDPSHSVQWTANVSEYITLPSISLPAMIACTVLLGLYMIPLLCLALYAALSARWTNTLDAFTMLRMGAALGAEELPMLIGTRKRKIEALDRLPGVVRDISGPDDKIRRLALGVEGGKPLRTNISYLSYPGNHDSTSPMPYRRWLQGE